MASPKQATSTQPHCGFRLPKEASDRADHLSPDRRRILLITDAAWGQAGRQVGAHMIHGTMIIQTMP
jgi:hypothetical protein